MSKSKDKKSDKGKGKGGQLLIRIEKDERKAFVDLCDKLDTSAAREVRRFIRGFIESHAADLAKPVKPAKKTKEKAALTAAPVVEDAIVAKTVRNPAAPRKPRAVKPTEPTPAN